MRACQACGWESDIPRKRCVICRRLICCGCWDVSEPSTFCASEVEGCEEPVRVNAGPEETTH